MRLVPEEAVRPRLARQRQAEPREVVAEARRVETRIRQRLPGQRRNLPVPGVVLQELADLLSAEKLADPPRVDQHLKPEAVRRLHDARDVRPPEIEIEFGDRQDHGRTAVIEHFAEIRFGVLHIAEVVIADGGSRD